MSKVFALAFAVAALAAFVSQASAGRHRGGCCEPTCCEAAAPCCGATAAAAPAPTADNNANAANNTAQAPQSTRSFSYQPSTNDNYAPVTRGVNRGRASFGARDAASKALGNY